MEESTEIGIGPVLKTGHRREVVCRFESYFFRCVSSSKAERWLVAPEVGISKFL